MNIFIPVPAFRLVFLCLSLLIVTDDIKADPAQLANLRCEYLADPPAIESLHPRLSWELLSDERNVLQTAYQILVAATPEQLARNEGTMWDSGKIPSRESNQIRYNGKALSSRQDCYWKVRVWDQSGMASAWSKPARWSMGLLSAQDWQAEWIGFDNRRLNRHPEFYLPPSPYFRKSWAPDKAVKKAVLYATALGLYEARINGKKVGEDYFTPGWTDYNQRVYYQAYDVTNMLQAGENALGFILANGWYAGYIGYAVLVGHPKEYGYYGEVPVFRAQLEVTYEDGTHATIGTDDSWKVQTGPILEADLLMGETYDARLELTGWDQPGYDEQEWKSSQRMVGAMGKLEAFPGVPVQVVETLEPVGISEPEPGKYIFNLGTNIAGIIELNIKGEAGDTIQLRYGEMLHPDGRLMTENLRRARAIDTYILRGDPAGESWRARFTYHGFQYVEVSGLRAKPDKDLISGLVLSSATPVTGAFKTGSAAVNQLYQNVVRSQRANYLDVPTDCPQRDERLGWTGDAQIYMRTATFNADIAAFHQKWMQDLQDAQLGNGSYPNFAPFPYHRPNMVYSPAWMDAGIICVYELFKVYNDRSIVKKYFSNMQALVAFYDAKSKANLLPEGAFNEVSPTGGFGDWLNQGDQPTSKTFIANVYWLYDLRLMEEMARSIGNLEMAEAYGIRFRQVREAFLAYYMGPDNRLKENTQTACALTIDLKILPDAKIAAVAAQLVELIEKNGGRLETGFLGTKHLLPALSSTGYTEEALRLFTFNGFPSWLYEVENGATSIWERWDSYTLDNGFGGEQNAGMNSFNHYAFGAVAEWMFRYLAGIDLAENGYREITIQPEPNARLSPVSATYHSINGEIASSWEVQGDDLILRISIPANTRARVGIPALSTEQVSESDKPIGELSADATWDKATQRVWLSVGSGNYVFRSKNSF